MDYSNANSLRAECRAARENATMAVEAWRSAREGKASAVRDARVASAIVRYLDAVEAIKRAGIEDQGSF